MPKVVYTEEFRRTAVELVAGGMSQKQVCTDMGCSKSALQSEPYWVQFRCSDAGSSSRWCS